MTSIMRDFSLSRMVAWVKAPNANGAPITDEVSVSEDVYLRIAQENDIRLICSLARKANASKQDNSAIVYSWPLSVDVYEYPLEVRSDLFNLSKDFFIVYEAEKPIGLLGLAPSTNPLLRYADICLLWCPAHIAAPCIAAAASFYRQEPEKGFASLHLNLSDQEISSNKGIQNLVNESAFALTGTFPGECSDGDNMNIYRFVDVW